MFTTPQVLLDKVTELTDCVYRLSAGEESTDPSAPRMPCRGEYLTMRDEGIISHEILRDFPKHYVQRLFTEKELVKIFEHLYIIAKVREGRYFMPALLPHFTPDDLKKLFENSSNPPLLFHFDKGCAPAGLFCALLVCLTSPKIGWKVHLGEPLKGVRSNAACLVIPGVRFKVIIVDMFHQFEVHYRCPSGRENFLSKIGEVISEALEEVVYNRSYNMPAFPTKCFFCRSEEHSGLPSRYYYGVLIFLEHYSYCIYYFCMHL